MTPTESATLRAIAEKQWLTKSEIAEKTGSSRRTLYVACKRLVAEGLLQVKPSLKDTRQTFYGLTEAGRRAVS